MRGATIQIYLKDGSPDGLLIVEKSNWVGQALVCPRPKFSEHKKRSEFERAGIYVLTGPPEEKDLPRIYIGEADPLINRLESHNRNVDFWTRMVAFSSKDANLNKAHIKYLESRLHELAVKSRKADVSNTNTPTRPSLSESETDEMEAFLDEVRVIFPVIGLDYFEPTESAGRAKELLVLKARGIEAQGFESPKGFVVVKGSHAARTEAPSTHKYLQNRRAALLSTGLFKIDGDTLLLAEDYTFDSPSTAAGVMMGRSANGRTAWKTKKGKTLKELQEALEAATQHRSSNSDAVDDQESSY